MKDRVQQDIGAKKTLTEWSHIEWMTVMNKVKNLRQRIYRATQEKQWNRVRSLQKLLIRSHSNLLLSVYRVTQANQGKRTPGVDGKLIKTPQDRLKLVNQWNVFHKTESGTPQGGIISPLLANIALDGMDDWLGNFQKIKIGKTYQYGKKKVQSKYKYRKYGFIRYADDFLITAESKEGIEEILPRVIEWLANRGLKLNQEKTQIKHISEGINFLGFNIRQYQGKCLIKPQKEKLRGKLREIKSWLYEHPNLKPKAVIKVLNPILRGWANYYKHGVSSRSFNYFDHRMVKMLIKWAKKRHPNKGGEWVVPRYFGRIKGNHWVFKAISQDRKGNKRMEYLYKMASTKITRHVKVKGKGSPDDPTLQDYWEKRQSKYGKSYFAKGSKLYIIAENQKWKCPVCGEHLFNGENFDTHHKIEVTEGRNDEIDNLVISTKNVTYISTVGRRKCPRKLEPYEVT